MCSNYEAQLHRVQQQFTVDLEEKDREVDRLRAEQEKYKVKRKGRGGRDGVEGVVWWVVCDGREECGG